MKEEPQGTAERDASLQDFEQQSIVLPIHDSPQHLVNMALNFGEQKQSEEQTTGMYAQCITAGHKADEVWGRTAITEWYERFLLLRV